MAGQPGPRQLWLRVLGLAAVAITVENDDNDGDSGGGERVEHGRLVEGSQFGVAALMFAALNLPVRHRRRESRRGGK
jgi:hypothetical protein